MDRRSKARAWAVIGQGLVAVVLIWSLLAVSLAMAAEGKDGAEAKMISGMSIVGNNEAPKSLFIVPWKSSEIGVETGLSSGLDDSMGPVDRDVFMRELDYYEIRNAN